MPYEKIIILIASIVGILLLKKTKPDFLKGILLAFILSFGLSLFGNQGILKLSFVLFGVLSFIFSLYSGINKQWSNLTIGFFAFISFLFKFMHYPFLNELRLLMIIPIVIYITLLTKHKFKNKQLSIINNTRSL